MSAIQETTFISNIEMTNVTSIDALKEAVISNMSLLGFIYNVKVEWITIEDKEMENKDGKNSGIHRLNIGDIFLEMNEISSSVVYIAMYCKGRLRRSGSSCSYFEEIMDCLRVQLTNPDKNLTTISECYKFEYPPMSEAELEEAFPKPLTLINPDSIELTVNDDEFLLECLHLNATLELVGDEEELEEELEEDYDSDDEDEDSEEATLKDMTDGQINDYIEDAGVEPRDEIDEWTMNYTGGPILRYSYTTFNTATVSSQTVENCIIRCVSFNNTTLKNCRFSRISFYECDFTDVKIKNTKFKRCKFFNCELPAYVQLEKNSLICSY